MTVRAPALLTCAAWAALALGCAPLRLPTTVAAARDLSRGMWVWSSAALLDEPAAQQELFAFSRARGIETLWMQITTERLAEPDAARLRLAVSQADAWRALLAAAHAQRLRVEALDGDPTYADRAFHDVPLAITDAVLAFNRGGRSDERFDGLHFDNEPYLLPGWHDRPTRERLLVDYLTLNDEIQHRVRLSPPMTYTVDLPFWWSAIDPATGEPIAAVTYAGVRQSATAHSLGRLDAVTVMNYRNHTAGPDGLVAVATPVLTEGMRWPRARIRIGVETSRFRESRVWFAIGPPAARIGDTLGQSWRRLYPGDAFLLRTFDDGSRVHLGVTVPESGAGRRPPEALLDIAARFSPRWSGADAPEVAAAVRAFGASAEWREARPAPIVDPETGIKYAGVTAVNVPLAKLTFATRPRTLDDELRAAERAFRQFAAYQGAAIHHYDAFREVTESARVPVSAARARD